LYTLRNKGLKTWDVDVDRRHAPAAQGLEAHRERASERASEREKELVDYVLELVYELAIEEAPYTRLHLPSPTP
jgi:hypothetical protein